MIWPYGFSCRSVAVGWQISFWVIRLARSRRGERKILYWRHQESMHMWCSNYRSWHYSWWSALPWIEGCVERIKTPWHNRMVQLHREVDLPSSHTSYDVYWALYCMLLPMFRNDWPMGPIWDNRCKAWAAIEIPFPYRGLVRRLTWWWL